MISGTQPAMQGGTERVDEVLEGGKQTAGRHGRAENDKRESQHASPEKKKGCILSQGGICQRHTRILSSFLGGGD